MKNTATIQSVKRESDGKIFSIGQEVFSLGLSIGIIDGFCQFKDDFRIHIKQTDEDSEDCQYFSLFEID